MAVRTAARRACRAARVSAVRAASTFGNRRDALHSSSCAPDKENISPVATRRRFASHRRRRASKFPRPGAPSRSARENHPGIRDRLRTRRASAVGTVLRRRNSLLDGLDTPRRAGRDIIVPSIPAGCESHGPDRYDRQRRCATRAGGASPHREPSAPSRGPSAAIELRTFAGRRERPTIGGLVTSSPWRNSSFLRPRAVQSAQERL